MNEPQRDIEKEIWAVYDTLDGTDSAAAKYAALKLKALDMLAKMAADGQKGKAPPRDGSVARAIGIANRKAPA